MSVKKLLKDIQEIPTWINAYNNIKELVKLLETEVAEAPKASAGGYIEKTNVLKRLDDLFTATSNRRNTYYYYTFVINKLRNLFPSKSTEVTMLYTNDMNIIYMAQVFAEYLSNSSYIGKTFDDIIQSIDDLKDVTGFSKIVIDPNSFLNGTLTAAPVGHSKSWNLLLDLLAGEDVDADSAGEEKIKERLNNSRTIAAGDSVKSIDEFLASASEEQKEVFSKNLEQRLLIQTYEYCASFRDAIRFFELFDITDKTNRDDIKAKFNQNMGSIQSSTYHLFQKSLKPSLPYGGRICPIKFGTGETPINNIKSHPFAWKFFRDITSETHVIAKLGFYKMIYRNGKQYEALMDINLPEDDGLERIKREEITTEETKTFEMCGNSQEVNDLQNIKLESFNISFKGTTPTTAQNDVDVTITMHIPRISSLDKRFTSYIKDENDNLIAYDWKILDFITYYGNSDIRSELDLGYIQNTKYSGLNSRIILKIGYIKDKMPDIILKDVLENSALVLDLSVIDHTIAKDPVKPSAKLTIKYAGFIMKAFNSPSTDVLAGDDLGKRLERQKILNFSQEQNCQPKIVEEIYETNRKLNKVENKDFQKNLIDTLYTRSRVFKTPYYPSTIRTNSSVVGENIFFSADYYNSFLSDLGQANFDQWDAIINNKKEDIETNLVSTLATSDTYERDFIYWTTVGDVIDAAMDTIYEDQGVNKDDVVGHTRQGNGELSSQKMKGFFRNNPLKVLMTEVNGRNLADYPISINFLREWITTEIVEQDFDFYPLVGFIKQILQACVTNFINNTKSSLESPTVVAVDTDLSLGVNPALLEMFPISDTGEGATPTTANQQSFVGTNKTFWDGSWAPKITSFNKKSNSSQNMFSSPLKYLKNQIKNNNYEAACGKNDFIDYESYEKYIDFLPTYGVPLVVKRFDNPRQDYFNIIYCYTYPSGINMNVESESDCIANGIPVIKSPDFQYIKVKLTADEQYKVSDLEQTDLSYEQQVAGPVPLNPTPPTGEGDKETDGDKYTNPIIKSIKFTKKDDDYLREARYSSQHYGMFAQLTSVYSVTVELSVLCTFLVPGMIVYIDGDTGDTIFQEGSLANTLGLGGLHIITSVQHKSMFEENDLKDISTTFDALYLYKGNNVKTSSIKKPATIKKENKRKEEICNALFDNLISADGTDSNPELTNALLGSAIVDNQSSSVDLKSYYNSEQIKTVYEEMFLSKNPGNTVSSMSFIERWEPLEADLPNAGMYTVEHKPAPDGESKTSTMNVFGDIIDG